MGQEVSPLSHPVIHFIFSLAYLFVFLATIIGNVIILCVFVSQRRLRSVPKFFLVNLTVADLFVGCFCVLQNAAHFVMFEQRWPFGQLLCHTYIYLLHLIPNVSAGILVLVSVERLVAVLRPLGVRRAFPRKVLIGSSACVWICSSIMNLPYFFAVQYIQFEDRETGESFSVCTRDNIEWREINVLKWVTTINFIVWYAIPLLVLLFIYATIFAVIGPSEPSTSTTTKQTKPVLLNKGLPGQHGWRCESQLTVERRRRVGRLAFGIVLSFATLSLPRYLYIIWSTWRDNNENRCVACIGSLMQPLTFLLLFLNSAINPFLYAFLSARFRESIRDTFYCRTEIDKRRHLAIEMSCKVNQRRNRLNSEYDTLNDSQPPTN